MFVKYHQFADGINQLYIKQSIILWILTCNLYLVSCVLYQSLIKRSHCNYYTRTFLEKQTQFLDWIWNFRLDWIWRSSFVSVRTSLHILWWKCAHLVADKFLLFNKRNVIRNFCEGGFCMHLVQHQKNTFRNEILQVWKDFFTVALSIQLGILKMFLLLFWECNKVAYYVV